MGINSEWNEKQIVVTGGAHGIGEAIVRMFLQAGSKAAIIDKNKAALDLLKDEFGDRLSIMQGDVADKETLETFAQLVTKNGKKVDVLVNNACFSNHGLLSECSYEQFNEVLRTGVTAPYYLTQLFMPYFAAHASIVNISSTRSLQSQKDTESYSAAKGALSSLTHAMAMSLSPGVRVNSVSPGWIEVNPNDSVPVNEDLLQHPSGRIGRPEDIAQAVMFLCREENRFINGTDLTVDGGMSKRMIYHNDEGWVLKEEVCEN